MDIWISVGRWRLGQLCYPHPSQGKPNRRELGEMNYNCSNSFFLAAVFGISGGLYTPYPSGILYSTRKCPMVRKYTREI